MPLFTRPALLSYAPSDVPNVGEYLVNAGITSAQSSGAFTAAAVSQMQLFVIDVHERATYDTASINVTTAVVGATSGAARLGLYGTVANGSRPNLADLRYDWGQTPTITTTGAKTITPASPFTLEIGRYWGAVALQIVGTPTTYPVFTNTTSTWAMPSTSVMTVGVFTRSWGVANVTGALPTIGTLIVPAFANAPILNLRRSA